MVYFLIYFLIKKRNGKNIKRPAGGGGGRIGMRGRYEGGGIGIGALFTFIRRVSGIG